MTFNYSKGKFIVFEGIDGCGKGTQIKKVANYLFDKEKRNHIVLTREPTMISSYGKKVRELLSQGFSQDEDVKRDAAEFTRLYVKDRAFHLKKIIMPAINSGCIVLSDRYKYSTFAYQLAQGEKLDKLIKLHKNFLIPDLTIILDIPAEESIKRLPKVKKKDLFEKVDFLRTVRENYLKMREMFPNEKIVIINGNKKEEKVFEEIKKEIDSLF